MFVVIIVDDGDTDGDDDDDDVDDKDVEDDNDDCCSVVDAWIITRALLVSSVSGIERVITSVFCKGKEKENLV